LITQYGYVAVFLLMLAESACIPIPSEVIMLFGGALAAGAYPGAHPTLIGIVLAGVLGNVAGSYSATAWFDRYGSAAVLFGRMVPVVRTFISLPAGFAGMPAGRFGLFTTLGCIPWTAALGIAGYALGANWQHIANDFHGLTYAIAGIVVVALVVAVVLYFRRRGGDADVSEPAGTDTQLPSGRHR
jgi:membrane protein DedA with SNARE-associated domain